MKSRALKQRSEIRNIINALKKDLSVLYGERLKDVMLYGSWARGEATIDSDIDVAVVLDGKVIPGKEIDRMIDIVTDLNLEYSVLLSIYPVSSEGYSKIKSPLLLNIHKEGIAV